MLPLHFLLILASWYFLPGTSTVLNPVEPILWKEIETGDNEVVAVMDIPFPCDEFQGEMQKCQEEFEKHIFQPFRATCEPHSRKKRGIWRKKKGENGLTKSKGFFINSLRRKKCKIGGNCGNGVLNTFKNGFKTGVGSLHQQLKNVISNAQDILALTTALGIAGATVTNFQNNWENGVFNKTILDVFDTDIDPETLEVLQRGTPKSCHFDDKDKTLYTIVEDPYVLKTFEAYPFTLKNPDYEMKIHYIGPSRVVYDPKNDCIINDSTSTEKICRNEKFDSHLQHWTKTCELVHDKKEQFAQMQLVDGITYHIYCAGLKIKASGGVLDCPDFVFSLPKKDFIEIIGTNIQNTFDSKTLNATFKSEVSEKVTRSMMPSIKNLYQFSTFSTGHSCDARKTFPWTYIVASVLIILIVVAGIAGIFAYKKRGARKGTTGSSQKFKNTTYDKITNNNSTVPIVHVCT